MANKCDTCTEKCPQAERAHQAALGRMYATKEFIALLKKVESRELVEAIRCKDCKFSCQPEIYDPMECNKWATKWGVVYTEPNGFCHKGERREGE